jgi:hypothetical protein
MDKHEKGIEIDPYRPDAPLTRWDGKYGGDQKRLPKVVQKLVLRRPLTPEEKAELLWRFYELEQGGRARRGLIGVLMVMVLCAVCVAGYLVYTHQIPFLAALAPPR